MNHLDHEGTTSGPDSVARKGYWIVELAPHVSDWTAPRYHKQIISGASKAATLSGLTGGAHPVTRAEMRTAIRSRKTATSEQYQAILFAAACYLTVSRGIEIYNLTPEKILRTTSGDLRLTLGRTKTAVGVVKTIPNTLIDTFNPGRAIGAWIDGLDLGPDQRIWRKINGNMVSRKEEAGPDDLRRQLKAVFSHEKIGWHSFRKGAASELALGGTPLEALLATGTWANVTSLRPYIGNAIRTNEGYNREQARRLLGRRKSL